MKYDKEEKAILAALEVDILSLSKPDPAELAAIKAAATSTFKKDRRVTIRLYATIFAASRRRRWKWACPTRP